MFDKYPKTILINQENTMANAITKSYAISYKGANGLYKNFSLGYYTGLLDYRPYHACVLELPFLQRGLNQNINIPHWEGFDVERKPNLCVKWIKDLGQYDLS